MAKCPHCHEEDRILSFWNGSGPQYYCNACGDLIDEDEILLTCPHCKTDNPVYAWNDATTDYWAFERGVEAESVCLIGEEGCSEADFVCPSCYQQVLGAGLGLREEVEEAKR